MQMVDRNRFRFDTDDGYSGNILEEHMGLVRNKILIKSHLSKLTISDMLEIQALIRI
jgi:hypothetical protein